MYLLALSSSLFLLAIVFAALNSVLSVALIKLFLFDILQNNSYTSNVK